MRGKEVDETDPTIDFAASMPAVVLFTEVVVSGVSPNIALSPFPNPDFFVDMLILN
jgi:hypothetical protein